MQNIPTVSNNNNNNNLTMTNNNNLLNVTSYNQIYYSNTKYRKKLIFNFFLLNILHIYLIK